MAVGVGCEPTEDHSSTVFKSISRGNRDSLKLPKASNMAKLKGF